MCEPSRVNQRQSWIVLRQQGPFVSFEPHAAANGASFSPPAFGFAGDAFVALFGDIAPVTTVRLATPRGFKSGYWRST